MKTVLALIFIGLALPQSKPLDKATVQKFLSGEGIKEWRQEKVLMKSIMIEPIDLVWRFESEKITVLAKGNVDTSYTYEIKTIDGKNNLHLRGEHAGSAATEKVYEIKKLTLNDMELADPMAVNVFHSPPGLYVPKE